jgi:hypothetical protein
VFRKYRTVHNCLPYVYVYGVCTVYVHVQYMALSMPMSICLQSTVYAHMSRPIIYIAVSQQHSTAQHCTVQYIYLCSAVGATVTASANSHGVYVCVQYSTVQCSLCRTVGTVYCHSIGLSAKRETSAHLVHSCTAVLPLCYRTVQCCTPLYWLAVSSNLSAGSWMKLWYLYCTTLDS